MNCRRKSRHNAQFLPSLASLQKGLKEKSNQIDGVRFVPHYKAIFQKLTS